MFNYPRVQRKYYYHNDKSEISFILSIIFEKVAVFLWNFVSWETFLLMHQHLVVYWQSIMTTCSWVILLSCVRIVIDHSFLVLLAEIIIFLKGLFSAGVQHCTCLLYCSCFKLSHLFLYLLPQNYLTAQIFY